MDQHTRKRDLIYLTNAHFTKRGSTKDRRHVVFGVIPFTTVASLYGYTSSPGYCAPVAHRNTRKFAGEFHVREGGGGGAGEAAGGHGRGRNVWRRGRIKFLTSSFVAELIRKRKIDPQNAHPKSFRKA